ncbi:Fe-S protein assembly co-chaperone HscB [Massilia sp. TS11]|uniref:Fe-S protein assembly co-chaperone HscB n=1 Tax=Massilia sp. TS11 TaxID=2908003 RepID=UPI001EDA7A8D|nr:Fe-S protein assembly co-chaperone HscB [Massilia sp. TS11]MCG2583200.1 Fe-S protein assembly co-chaperone HscB [Massilia sp. TS11]
MQNHFELFQLPVRFAVDSAALEAAYREIQARVHPDKFVNASDAEQRVAMQWATRANEAYQTLKQPHKRAAYLCELHGVPLEIESNTSMPIDFLMQQMAWREALEEARAARDGETLDALEAQLRQARRARLAEIETQLDAGDFRAAATGVRALMFLDKFGEEIGDAFESLDN